MGANKFYVCWYLTLSDIISLQQSFSKHSNIRKISQIIFTILGTYIIERRESHIRLSKFHIRQHLTNKLEVLKCAANGGQNCQIITLFPALNSENVKTLWMWDIHDPHRCFWHTLCYWYPLIVIIIINIITTIFTLVPSPEENGNLAVSILPTEAWDGYLLATWARYTVGVGLMGRNVMWTCT
jgi:hypothetical protein